MLTELVFVFVGMCDAYIREYLYTFMWAFILMSAWHCVLVCSACLCVCVCACACMKVRVVLTITCTVMYVCVFVCACL